MQPLALLLLGSGLAIAQVTPFPRPASPQVPAPSYKPEELGTMAGIVRHSVTGEPIRKANLVLMRTDPRANQNAPATTSTNAEGRFAMTGIEPGPYRLSVSKAGFVPSDYGRGPGAQGISLTLEKGQSMKDVELKLSPQAVVTGRITDDENDPVMHAQVALMRYRFMMGKKQLVPGGMAMTNDLGEYRIFGVPPGRYYVTADSQQRGYNFGVDRSAVRQPEESPASTYYPNATDAQSAALVNVPMGGTVQGIDIRMRKERAFRIAGKVSGGGEGRGGMVNLVRKDSLDLMAMNRNMSSWRGPSGEFEIKGVRPGSYFVRAHWFDGPNQQMTGSAAVEVTDRDVEGVPVMLAPGLEVSGSIRSEDGQAALVSGMSVMAEGRAGRFSPMGSGTGRVKDDGTFQIANLGPDQYDVRVMGLPSGYFIRGIRLAETDVRENGLNLSGGGSAAGMEIVLSGKAAQLEGTVADAKGNPLRSAAVVLRPKSGKAWELAAMQPVASDQNGKFRLQGLAPGEYHLIAFEGVESAEAMDPDFFKEYESKAETVKLAESAAETRAVKAVTVQPR